MLDRSFLNWPFFEERHRALAERLESWAAEHCGHVDHRNVDAVCRELVLKLGRDGWLKHSAPGDDPSEKIDVRTLALIRETLARHSGLADFAFAMQGLGAGPISLFGTAAQKAQWLPKTRSGAAIAAFALSEPASGSDVANISTTARRDGDGYALDGEKTWISNGGIADLYVVFARTGEARGAKGLSAFVVRGDNPGLLVAERIETIAPHPLARLAFKNCRVGAADLIGANGDGFKIAMATLDVFRTSVGAAALGFARRAFAETLKRAKSRELFGAPLSELQMVQGHVADMALEIDAAALLVYRAAWTKDTGAARVTREAAMAKLYATESAQRVIDAAVQIHGGDGVRAGHPVETLYREIRALRIYEGASDVQKIIIARSALSSAAGH
ncbi:MAG TPA: acyl-CoA dehydrogenase family protein [Pseudolabrys sp.]|jgi:acyl-CoA dehydrogenase|nr:acyl-CoA dehydrogenase family protein [Pseudolabrys sp.]